jgi:hypothetical protein
MQSTLTISTTLPRIEIDRIHAWAKYSKRVEHISLRLEAVRGMIVACTHVFGLVQLIKSSYGAEGQIVFARGLAYI